MRCETPGCVFKEDEAELAAVYGVEKGCKCCFCDKPATGAWTTSGECLVGVCSECAFDVLPKLIADAIWLPPFGVRGRPMMSSACRFWSGVLKATFLYAVGLRIEREGGKLLPDAVSGRKDEC